MSAYYNEHDSFAAQWLRKLIAAGHIAAGDVDERDIQEVQPSDLEGYHQVHFFAGLGGWSYALRLAGVPDDATVWTGSCPCQPFSSAGKQRGLEDPRHLWPAFSRLIAECRPPIVFGEQVAGADGLGWLDLVSDDLEGMGYAVGAADLCAAGVGAPHVRQRLYWMAHATSEGSQRPAGERVSGARWSSEQPPSSGGSGGMAHAQRRAAERHGLSMGGPSQEGQGAEEERKRIRDDAGDGRELGGTGFWSDADWITLRDGTTRPIEPRSFPLAHGVPNRVGRLRAYGNAIVPQVASEFIKAAMP